MQYLALFLTVICIILLIMLRAEKKKRIETIIRKEEQRENFKKSLSEAVEAEVKAYEHKNVCFAKWEKERQNMLDQIGSQNQSIIKLEATVKSLRNSLDAKARRHSRHPNNNHKTKASV